jgi:alanyl-tRNA synthetase
MSLFVLACCVQIGVPVERIKRMGAEDNFWSSGPTGPCGPCSELYYDFHPEKEIANSDLSDDSRFIEFYNLVFMQYNRTDDGRLEPLKNKNIDTGLGLERMAQILQQVPNNYETDLIFPIIARAAELAGVNYMTADESTKTFLKVCSLQSSSPSGLNTHSLFQCLCDGLFRERNVCSLQQECSPSRARNVQRNSQVKNSNTQ